MRQPSARAAEDEREATLRACLYRASVASGQDDCRIVADEFDIKFGEGSVPIFSRES